MSEIAGERGMKKIEMANRDLDDDNWSILAQVFSL